MAIAGTHLALSRAYQNVSSIIDTLMLRRKTLRDRIATAIRDSDDAWLNENYQAQAQAVLDVLRDKNYVFAPTKLSQSQVRYVLTEMPFGRMQQAKYLPEMYDLFLAAAREEPYVGRSPEDTLSSAIEMLMDSDPAGAALILNRVQQQREERARQNSKDLGLVLAKKNKPTQERGVLDWLASLPLRLLRKKKTR